MKRKLLLFSLALVVCFSAAMVACTNNKVTINAPTEVTMAVYDVKDLDVTVLNYEGEPTLVSSDPTVVEVQGKTLYAYKEGTAVIVITAGEARAEVNVTVTAPQNSPAISVPTLNVRVVVGNTFAFAPEIKMGEQTVEGELSVSVADQTVATYANGVITALKIGSTTLTVSGTYFGTNLRQVTVNIVVIDDLIVSYSAQSVDLFTYAPEGGESLYPTEQTITVTVEEQGELVDDPEITWEIADEKVATVTDGRVVAVGEGTTTITATYKTVETPIAVTVTKTLLSADTAYKEYDMNPKDDTADYIVFDLGNEFTMDEITGVYDYTSGTKVPVTYDTAAGELRLDEENIPVGEVVLVVENADYGKTYEALIATKFIYDKDDLTQMMDLATEGYAVHTEQDPGRDFYQGADGYFALADDIDFEGDAFRLTAENAQVGFIGTLDGRGHSISNVCSRGNGNGPHGMFGKICGTIKNVAFLNVVGSYNNTNTDTSMNMWQRFNILGSVAVNGYILDVFVLAQRTDLMQSVWGQGVVGGYEQGGTVNNLVCEIVDVVTDLSDSAGNRPGIAIGQLRATPAFAEDWLKNIYSVGAYDVIGIGSPVNYLNVKGYSSWDEFVDDENDFTPFDDEIWDLTGGVPVLKSIAEKMKAETVTISAGEFITAGGTLALGSTSEWMTSYEIVGTAPEGVSVEGNVLSADTTVPHNTQLTVRTYNPIYPEVYDEATVTVLNIVPGAAHTDFDLSTEAASYTVTLTEEIAPQTITAGEVTLTPANYSVSGTALTVTAAGVTEILNGADYGDFELIILDEDGSAYSVELSIVTKILYDKNDAIEMMSLATEGYNVAGGEGNSTATDTKAAQPNHYTGADGYFILAADIDMEGEILRTAYQSGTFYGIFDGRGHKISNIGSYNYKLLDGSTADLTNSSSGIFGQIAGIVRNVAFVNVAGGNDTASPVVRQDGRSIAIALRVLTGGVVENVYVSYSAKASWGWGCGAFGILDNGGATITNVVVERTNAPGHSTGANDGVVSGVGTSATISNVFGICAEMQKSTMGTIYASYDAMAAAELDLSGFDAAYWDVSNGYPVFKACME